MEVLASRQARYIAWVLSDLDRLYTLPIVLNHRTIQVPMELIESELFNEYVKPYLDRKQLTTSIPMKEINMMYFSLDKEANQIDGVIWQPLHVPACYTDEKVVGLLNKLVRKDITIKADSLEQNTLVIPTFDPEVFAELKDYAVNFTRLLEFASKLDTVE